MRFFSQNLPDIDELLKKWANRFFHKKNKEDSEFSDGGDEEPPESGIVIPTSAFVTLFCAVIFFIYLFVGFFTVAANERVVMFRLGEPFDVRGPGLKWHLPIIEDYRKVNVSEVRRVEVGYSNDTKNKNLRESLMLTQDLNIIDMQFVVQYALSNPEDFLFENRFVSSRAEDVVKQVAETAMREIVGRSSIDFVLYEGRESIASEALALMQEILSRYKTGIEVQQVAVQNVQPPDQVQDAFEDAIKARQDRERKINEGQAYANDILPRVKGQASRILKEAEAYEESLIIAAKGQTERFLHLAEQYIIAPEITRRRLYLETMERVFSRANKIIIDDNGGENNNGHLFYIPLDKLIAPGSASGKTSSFKQSENNFPLNNREGGEASTIEQLKQKLRGSSSNALQ